MVDSVTVATHSVRSRPNALHRIVETLTILVPYSYRNWIANHWLYHAMQRSQRGAMRKRLQIKSLHIPAKRGVYGLLQGLW